MGLGARNDGVPHGVRTRRKTLERIGHHVQHLAVVALHFIAGIAQQQGAAGWWGQKFLDAFKTIFVQHRDLPARIELGHIARQCAHVGGVQLKHLELVVFAQQPLTDEGGAGIHLGLGALVEGAHHVYVGCQRRGQGRYFRGDQAQNAIGGFGAGAGVVAVQAVQACARVGVQHGQRRVFLRKVLQSGNQNGVLEHIGMVARVEGVAVTEHVAMVTIAGRLLGPTLIYLGERYLRSRQNRGHSGRL